MVAAGLPDGQCDQPGAYRGVAHDVDRGGKVVERTTDDKVGEAVVDDEDFDAAVAGIDEGLPDPFSVRVTLPDVGFEKDLRLRSRDGLEHGGIEILTVGVGSRG